MKKIFLILICIVLIAASISVAINFASKQDAEPRKDIDNQNEIIFAKKLIDVPAISQYPELPTGCESAAAAMVLQYYDVNITAEEFARDWLDCSENFYTLNGKLFGPDPNEVFVGNPFTANSYGCFANPIVKAIIQSSTNCTANKITGKSLEWLCNNYIDNDKPLLIWATMSMKESYKGKTWYLEDGSAFTWIAGEHCLVLVGYNDGYYFLNDPMSGSIVAYQKSIVERRFSELGKQAIFITKIER